MEKTWTIFTLLLGIGVGFILQEWTNRKNRRRESIQKKIEKVLSIRADFAAIAIELYYCIKELLYHSYQWNYSGKYKFIITERSLPNWSEEYEKENESHQLYKLHFKEYTLLHARTMSCLILFQHYMKDGESMQSFIDLLRSFVLNPFNIYEHFSTEEFLKMNTDDEQNKITDIYLPELKKILYEITLVMDERLKQLAVIDPDRIEEWSKKMNFNPLNFPEIK